LLRGLEFSPRAFFFFVSSPAGWTYWELRCEWKTTSNKKQDWKELPTPLFDVDTVEDFWVCYNKCPKIVCVFPLSTASRARPPFVARRAPPPRRPRGPLCGTRA
jgi:hypothetical protein